GVAAASAYRPVCRAGPARGREHAPGRRFPVVAAIRGDRRGRGRDTLGGMCGRYATTRTAVDLSAIFDAPVSGGPVGAGEIAVDYNVAPTDPVPVVRMSAT